LCRTLFFSYKLFEIREKDLIYFKKIKLTLEIMENTIMTS